MMEVEEVITEFFCIVSVPALYHKEPMTWKSVCFSVTSRYMTTIITTSCVFYLCKRRKASVLGFSNHPELEAHKLQAFCELLVFKNDEFLLQISGATQEVY